MALRGLVTVALTSIPVAASPQGDVAVTPARIVARLPHDPRAFTEGLFFRDGAFYESTGEIGRSTIRKVDPVTGKVLKSVTIPPPYFGEGIAPLGDQIVSLTWQHHLGWRWSRDTLKRLGSFGYAGEGWALAAGRHELYMSDGTSNVRVLDPKTLAVTRTIAVTYNGAPLALINEIELVDGMLLANVWKTAAIVRIDPANGRVTGVIDLSPLVREVAATNPEAVPNGIAWDAKRRKLYVTGKLWPTIFEIVPPTIR